MSSLFDDIIGSIFYLVVFIAACVIAWPVISFLAMTLLALMIGILQEDFIGLSIMEWLLIVSVVFVAYVIIVAVWLTIQAIFGWGEWQQKETGLEIDENKLTVNANRHATQVQHKRTNENDYSTKLFGDLS